jgi:hypothetical protein
MTNRYDQRSRAARAGLVALMLAVLVGSAQAGEIYKWVDDTGGTHYSDTVSAGVKAQRVSEGDLSIIPSTTPRDSTLEAAPASDAEPAPIEDQREAAAAQAYSERRQRMIEDCEQNNGIDCEREVDTELGAEAIQQGGYVIHQMRSAGVPTR